MNNDEILKYLIALFGTKDDEHYILIWEKRGNATKDPKESFWHQEVDKAHSKCIELAEAGKSHVYAGVNLSPKRYGPNKRCLKKDIVAVTGIYADLDLLSGPAAHKKENLPATQEEAVQLLHTVAPQFDCTMLVNSGFGLHPYWLFKEPYLIESQEDYEYISGLIDRWQAMLHAAGTLAGWNFDKTQDLSRVLRVPGTPNIKDPKAPVDASIVWYKQDRRPEPSDLLEFLDSLPPESAPRTQELPGGSKSNKVIDFPTPINMNRDASPSIDRMEDLFQLYPKAKAAWEGRSKKLSSMSHGDMSLLWHAREAGWSDQECFNLIVAFRRKHHGKGSEAAEKPFVHRTYFSRTISKIKQLSAGFKDGELFAEAHGDSEDAGSVAVVQHDIPAAIEALRVELGIHFKVFHRYGKQNCQWEVEMLSGQRAGIGSTNELLKGSALLDAALLEADCQPTSKRWTLQAWKRVVWRMNFTATKHDDIETAGDARLVELVLDYCTHNLEESGDASMSQLVRQAKVFVAKYKGTRFTAEDLGEGGLALYLPLNQLEDAVRRRDGNRAAGGLSLAVQRLGFAKSRPNYYSGGSKGGRSYYVAGLANLPGEIRTALAHALPHVVPQEGLDVSPEEGLDEE